MGLLSRVGSYALRALSGACAQKEKSTTGKKRNGFGEAPQCNGMRCIPLGLPVGWVACALLERVTRPRLSQVLRWWGAPPTPPLDRACFFSSPILESYRSGVPLVSSLIYDLQTVRRVSSPGPSGHLASRAGCSGSDPAGPATRAGPAAGGCQLDTAPAGACPWLLLCMYR